MGEPPQPIMKEPPQLRANDERTTTVKSQGGRTTTAKSQVGRTTTVKSQGLNLYGVGDGYPLSSRKRGSGVCKG